MQSENTLPSTDLQAKRDGELLAIAQLAALLQHLETSGVSHPEQYQTLAKRLTEWLQNVESGEDLQAVLDAWPAASQLYENCHFASAGLCRQPVTRIVSAEHEAMALLDRISKTA